MGIENRLVLELVPPPTPGERVLGPNDLAANLESRGFEGVLKLPLPLRGVADIHRGAGFYDLAVARKSRCQELPELLGGHPVPTDLEPLFGVAFVIDVIRRIGENQIHRLRRHEVFYVGSKGGVSTKHAMI